MVTAVFIGGGHKIEQLSCSDVMDGVEGNPELIHR